VSSLFGRKSGDELESLPKVELLDAAFTQESGTAIPVCDALVIGDLAASKNEARRLIKAGGVKVNDSKVTDEYALVRKEDFGQSGRLKLSASKKKHALILYRLP
jgi:tyrosyl-tRNA synthetase